MEEARRGGSATGEAQAGRVWRRWWLLLGALLALIGCGQPEANDETRPAPTTQTAPANTPQEAITPRQAEIPTLYPTFTPVAAQATPTQAMPATPTAGPSLDFSQKAVEFRYRIPALGLDRRLEGTIGAEITVVDETTGLASILQNQTGVMLELQQTLPELELEAMPEDCDRCVAFSYDLSLEGVSDEGWLRDPVILASVENYTTLALGPHFPPGTVVGLRRSATPYDVAHSLALTADGALWRWLATAPEIEAAADAATVSPDLAAAAAAVPRDELRDSYVVECMGVANEVLSLGAEGDPGVDTEDGDSEVATGAGRNVRIRCPAFSLPTTLLPLYVQLDALLEETVAEQGLPRPPLEIPLATLLDYRREDGGRLTLLLGGAVRAVDAAGEVFTDTIGASQVVSLTTGLGENGALTPGVETFAAGEAANGLLVRGPEGMMEAVWEGEAPAVLEPWLEELEQYLPATATPDASETGTSTPEAEGTAEPDSTPEATTTAEP